MNLRIYVNNVENGWSSIENFETNVTFFNVFLFLWEILLERLSVLQNRIVDEMNV